jgi:hypothetical protein
MPRPRRKQQPKNQQRLQEFLYVLMRDYLPTGAIEAIMQSHLRKNPSQKRVFDANHLAAYADVIATEILKVAR